jgi:hypothetical protein
VGNIVGDNAGGIVGSNNNGVVNFCYSTGKIIGLGAGGIVGANDNGIQKQCMSTNGVWNSSALQYLNNGSRLTWLNPIFNSTMTPFLLYPFQYYTYPRINVSITTNNLPFSTLSISGIPSIFEINSIAMINNSNPELYSFISLRQSTTIIDFASNTPPGQYNIVILSSTTPSYKKYNITQLNASISQLPCFSGGTYILTPSGEVLVEKLNAGDLITINGNNVRILDIFKRNINTLCEADYPVLIPKNFFATNVPSRDTYMSGWHAILWNNSWVQPIRNKNMCKTVPVDDISYYHIETPIYHVDNILANNMPCESWYKLHNLYEKVIKCDIENDIGIEFITVFEKLNV